MPSTLRPVVSFLAFSALALAIIGVPSLIWGALIYSNRRSVPDVPWALPALIVVLWLLWNYLGGRGWPASTARARRELLRANPVPLRSWIWSLIAGALALAGLAGLWITLFRLFPIGVNPLLPASFAASPVMIAAITVGASLLAPVTEESAIRGYLQGTLERSFRSATAVTLSSLVFALAHVSQGIALPKLFFYFVVGVVFGTLASVNNSILPVIPVHIAGDLTFFLFIWPHDASRLPVSATGLDGSFWLHAAQTMACTVLCILALRKLRPAR